MRRALGDDAIETAMVAPQAAAAGRDRGVGAGRGAECTREGQEAPDD